MEDQRLEEQRYCPTCQLKTPHWVMRKKIPPAFLLDAETAGQKGNAMRGDITKTECRACGTVENR